MNNQLFIHSNYQRLLVSGGTNGNGKKVDTTEIFDSIVWTNVGRLPKAMDYIQIINIDNIVLSFGMRKQQKHTYL